MRHIRPSVALVLVLGAPDLSLPALAQDQPRWEKGGLVFPEGAEIPAYLTDVERAYLAQHPITLEPAPRGPFNVPSGPIHCPAEYEPCDAVLIAWESFTPILSQMARWITTDGNADVYIVCDNAAEQTTAASTLQGAQVNMSRIRYVIVTTDTVWIRDYGPRYIYEGNCRAIIDHTYNRPRPYDDAFPGFFSTLRRHARYSIPLIHGGGNFHLSALGDSHATRLIINENPSLTEQQIHALWMQYQNLNTNFHTPFPTSVDSTQHIDMWMQITGDRSVVISDWPFDGGSIQDAICETAVGILQEFGYTVTRVPARSVSTVHYTYTNVVMCNDLVLVPSYTNPAVAPHNAEALAAWQAACPGKIIRQIDCQAMVSSAGVMHCVMMHIPAPAGGANPTAFLRTPRGGQTVIPGPGTLLDIRWISDDNLSVANADVLLSLDGGQSFPYVLAAPTADDGAFSWPVRNFNTTQARIRIQVRDADGNTGYDDSPADFTIAGTGCLADWNLSGGLDSQDFFDFLSGFFAGAADFNLSGATDSQDFFDFLTGFFGGC
jgi:agmatine/peptidylarginine deiminase